MTQHVLRRIIQIAERRFARRITEMEKTVAVLQARIAYLEAQGRASPQIDPAVVMAAARQLRSQIDSSLIQNVALTSSPLSALGALGGLTVPPPQIDPAAEEIRERMTSTAAGRLYEKMFGTKSPA